MTMIGGGGAGRSPTPLAAFALGLAAGSVLALSASRVVLRARTNGDNGGDDDDDGELGERTAATVVASAVTSLPPAIRAEMLSRNSLYFGPSGQTSVEGSSVLVVGLGGVGSHAAHMLARAGVRYLRLVDFDNVTPSSLNRHACATLGDVGRPKATVLADFLGRVCPDASMLEVDVRVQMYTGVPEKDGSLLDPPPGSGGGQWDLVIDAIDDTPTKAKLIAHFAKLQIAGDIDIDGAKNAKNTQNNKPKTTRVICCMGAGGKADPTRVHVSDLRGASRDPLAASLRQKLRWLAKSEAKERKGKEQDENGGGGGGGNGGKEKDAYTEPEWMSCVDDSSRVAVIYSSEKTVAKLADATDEQTTAGLGEFGAMEGMRVRVLPVVGTMPAIMGQAMAALAICELGGKPFSPVGAERVGRNVRNRMLQRLKQREKNLEDESRSLMMDLASVDEDGEGGGNGAPTKAKSTTEGTRLPDDCYVGPVEIDVDDVEYLLCERWRNRCAANGDRLGTVLEFVRWDMSEPARGNNLVLLGAKSRKKWDDDMKKYGGDGREGLDADVRRRIEERLRECTLEAEEE